MATFDVSSKHKLEGDEDNGVSQKKICLDTLIENEAIEIDGSSSTEKGSTEIDDCPGSLETKGLEIDKQVSRNSTSLGKVNSQSHLPCETDVGITEYISKLSAFSCVIKERYSDFLVNEIDSDGNILRFTNMDEPPQSLPDIDSDILCKEDVLKLEELNKSDAADERPVSIDVTDKSKEFRTKIHVFIKKSFTELTTETKSAGDKKFIVAQKGSDFRRVYSSGGRGKYVHFILYKENTDTMGAISTISSFLRLKHKTFSYAGTKDKRGITVQAVSVSRVNPDKLLSINNKLSMIKIGNFSYKNTELKLGDLYGNRFVIVLRQLKGEEEIVKSSMESLSTHGFINYYGMQRFGTTSVPTHHVGRALLCGNWNEAIELILKPRAEGEDKHFSKLRLVWSETHNATEALKHNSRKGSIEGQLLKGLARYHEKDYVNALNCIPRNTRLIYIHSYQSYIWNKVVSRRIQKYGLQVLPGDLITEISDEPIADNDEEKVQSPIGSPTYVSEKNVNEEGLIHKVVLPLPGHSIMYPKNEIKSWYDEFLREDEMSLENFVSNVRTYSLSGSYRKIIVKPTDVKWEILSYNDNTIPLTLSDWDVLQNRTLTHSLKDGEHKALKIELTLPSSTYATMAIREISKVDTSIAAQKSMSYSL